MRSIKIILALAFLVGLVSSFQYINESMIDSLSLIGRDYSYKQDFIEDKYNGYMVYKYYLWLQNILPPDATYGLLVAKDDTKTHSRYFHRMNYFLYPLHIVETGSPRYLFAPNLRSDPTRPGYRLKAKFDGSGVFVKQ